MNTFKTLLLVAGAALVTCCGNASPPPPWKIVAIEGTVRVNLSGEEFHVGTTNEILSVGSVLSTGAKSSALVSNGLQIISVYANSRLSVPEDRHDGITRVLEAAGRMLFQVNHENSPHFEVETPLATAVVKGTVFEVEVGKVGTDVRVTQGLVDVRAAEGKAHQDVAGGFAAYVRKAVPADVVVYRMAEDPAAKGLNTAAPAPAAAPSSSGSPGSSGAAAPGLRSFSLIEDTGQDAAGAATGGAKVREGRTGSTAAASGNAASTSARVSPGNSVPDAAAFAEPASTSSGTSSQASPSSDNDEPKKDEKDYSGAWEIARYGGIIILAWLVFVPAIAIAGAMLRKRKMLGKKTETDAAAMEKPKPAVKRHGLTLKR